LSPMYILMQHARGCPLPHFLLTFSTEQVYPDPYAPQRWTLSSVRDHAIATPAAAAVRGAILRAR